MAEGGIALALTDINMNEKLSTPSTSGMSMDKTMETGEGTQVKVDAVNVNAGQQDVNGAAIVNYRPLHQFMCKLPSNENGEFIDIPAICAAEERRRRKAGIWESDGYDTLEKLWCPELMPDYNYDRRRAGIDTKLKSVATDYQTFAYYLSLKESGHTKSLEHKKKKHSHSHSHEKKHSHSHHSHGHHEKRKESSNSDPEQRIEKKEKHKKSSRSKKVNGKKRQKKTVWDTFSESIENALARGCTTCPIRGPRHPLEVPEEHEQNLTETQLQTDSEETNEEPIGDYLSTRPLHFMPPIKRLNL